MSLLDKLERKFGEIPVLNLTYWLIGGNIVVFFLNYFYPEYRTLFFLQGSLVLEGQTWRLVSFLFEPIVTDFFFAVFTWYIFYLYGTVLEKYWGSFKFAVYLLISYIGTITLAFLFPRDMFTNTYIYSSLFLAFAHEFPEFELRIFFILPVKVKWLALITWIFTLGSIIMGPIPVKIQTVVSVLNYILFFGQELYIRARRGFHSSTHKVQKTIQSKTPKHICSICGKNDIDDPYMGIRYCKKCLPTRCYCEEDFAKHKHVIVS